MKTTFCVATLALSFAFASHPALADDRAACLDASTRGQSLRNAHHLLEARKELRACARAGCPAVVQSDCANWLDEVEKALPSVVLMAKNRAGADLVDVKVSLDGKPLVATLDGQAVTIDAGPHAFHFEGGDGTSVDQQVVLNEGEQNHAIAVVLGPAGPSQEATPEAGATRHSGPWKTVGWVVGAVGVVGLGIGTAFGVMAISDNNSAHCNADKQCEPGPLSDARSAAKVSDVGFIAGGVLLAGGAALVLFAPRGGAEGPGVALRVSPLVGRGSGGMSLGGSF
jgi:hypothetical protein